ncbi:MAG: hypothetical protein HY077_14285 [Elusimicrobia bacterium]|nr:hypothetical protein [Elusimicrobiota bacterium]
MGMTRVQGLLFGALLLGSAGFYQPMDYDNTKSRYMLLSAIVDEGRLSIDSHQQYTIDKAFLGGHYYSIKPMGLPLMAVPVYWLLRKTWLGPASRLPDPTILADPAAKYLVRVATVSLPFAALGIILFQFLLAFGIPPRNALWSVLAYAFGTIALNHATIFSGHQNAAFFLFTSFAVLWKLEKGVSAGGRNAALSLLAGLCAGLAVLCDYLVVIYASIIAWYALSSRLERRAKGGFVVGASLCAAALGIFNFACFGSLFSTGYSHLAFEPFRQYTSTGLFGISWPNPVVLLSLLASVSRGLFFISPVLLFSLAGLVFMSRRPHRRRELWVLAGVPAAALVLYSGYPGWHGGWSYGSRYLVPVLPFLAVPMALAADGGPWFQLAFWLSVFQIACAQIGCPHASQEISNPVAEFMIPLMREGGTALSLLGAAQPGAVLGAILQYAVVAVLAAAALRGLPAPRPRRLPWRWRAVLTIWVGYAALALVLLRSKDAAMVHRYRGIVLNDTAAALRSMDLARSARDEMALGQPSAAP